jgi:hypothetical protein
MIRGRRAAGLVPPVTHVARVAAAFLFGAPRRRRHHRAEPNSFVPAASLTRDTVCLASALLRAGKKQRAVPRLHASLLIFLASCISQQFGLSAKILLRGLSPESEIVVRTCTCGLIIKGDDMPRLTAAGSEQDECSSCGSEGTRV